ncbi:MAG: 30S ribosomal protein S7 [bacterium]|nr:30S ribosomal protein S7 [bacterium]
MRRKRNYKRNFLGDIKYDSVEVTRFINVLMQDGKKTVAERVLYDALDIVEKETKEKALDVFNKALDNVTPTVEVSRKRVGGANYQVPIEVRPERKFMLAVRWIIGAANSSSGKPMSVRLAQEFIQASKGEGAAIKKKEDVHKMAEANRAFAHFARARRR